MFLWSKKIICLALADSVAVLIWSRPAARTGIFCSRVFRSWLRPSAPMVAMANPIFLLWRSVWSDRAAKRTQPALRPMRCRRRSAPSVFRCSSARGASGVSWAAQAFVPWMHAVRQRRKSSRHLKRRSPGKRSQASMVRRSPDGMMTHLRAMSVCSLKARGDPRRIQSCEPLLRSWRILCTRAARLGKDSGRSRRTIRRSRVGKRGSHGRLPQLLRVLLVFFSSGPSRKRSRVNASWCPRSVARPWRRSAGVSTRCLSPRATQSRQVSPWRASMRAKFALSSRRRAKPKPKRGPKRESSNNSTRSVRFARRSSSKDVRPRRRASWRSTSSNAPCVRRSTASC